MLNKLQHNRAKKLCFMVSKWLANWHCAKSVVDTVHFFCHTSYIYIYIYIEFLTIFNKMLTLHYSKHKTHLTKLFFIVCLFVLFVFKHIILFVIPCFSKNKTGLIFILLENMTPRLIFEGCLLFHLSKTKLQSREL